MKTPFFVQARRLGGLTSRPKAPQSVRGSAAAEAARGIVELLRADAGDAHGATRQGNGVGNVDHGRAVAPDEGEGPDRAAGRRRRLDRGARRLRENSCFCVTRSEARPGRFANALAADRQHRLH